MVERHDIDALLIGSLYGELSSADEALLQAHLESHPADRGALADLTRAREVVRASRILQVQYDPPQSISALLVQEAARRAPRAPASEGWFARFVRSFVAHPAMAAAAMLVLVVGVAGTLHLRKGDQFAQQTIPTSSMPAPAAPATIPPAPADPAAGLLETDGARDQAPSPAAGAPAANAGYQVDLADDPAAPSEKKQKQERARLAAPLEEPNLQQAAPRKEPADKEGKLQKAAEPDEGAAQKKKSDRKVGIEVTTPSPAPLDLDGETKGASGGYGAAGDEARPRAAKPAPSRAPTTTAAPADDSFAKEPPFSATVAPAPITSAETAAPPPPPRAATGASRSTDRTVGRAGPPPAEPRTDTPTTSWSRDQHARVVAQVRAGNCRDAAVLALELSTRDLAYFQSNVETDRSVKDCLAYINTARERDAAETQKRTRANRTKSTR